MTPTDPRDNPIDYPTDDARPKDGWRLSAGDDGFVVDTRGRRKRADGGSLKRRYAAGSADRAGAPAASGSARPRPQSAPRAADSTRRVEQQPLSNRPNSGARPPAGGTGRPRVRVRKWRITILAVLAALLAYLIFMIWVPFNAWSNVERVNNIPSGDRPADTSGYNYLLVGSDSREGLTAAQRKEYAAGDKDYGKRTDSIMLVHVSESGGKPVVVSFPRDSYVPIPGHGSNKINAAYAFGGAKLLTQTVENVTGIHIDGYIEIGFGGFASVVDSLGGINICVAFDMNDPKAGINLKKGCQNLNGKNALGYVRSRYTDPLGDLGRANRQRQFLGALMKKAATPSTVLVPWKFKSFADASAVGLVVGNETSLMDAYRVLQALRASGNGEGLSLTVPIADANYITNAGSSVKWDSEKALVLFRALKNDDPLTAPPPGTTTGSK